MTPQERDIIGRFIARVGGASAPGGFAGSVPSAQVAAPALPPIDPEADRFIADQFASHPEARYRITQMAVVQEAALAEAQNRIKQLDYQLGQATQALQQAQQATQSGQGHGFFSGLFGGGSQQAPRYASPQYAPPPQASYPPGYQPGMFGGGGGSGFLGSALTTAAGVAGGVLAADAITSMFEPHGYGMGGFGGGFGGGGGGWGAPGEVVNETVVNNYGDSGQADPWSGGADPAGAQGGGGDAWSGGAGGDDGGGSDWGGGDAGGDSGSWDSGGGDSGSF